jgi:hypothetical protein
VNFTRTAEADADTPGGTINMRTRRAFDSRGRRIDYNVGVNFNAEEFHLKRTWGNRESKETKFKPNYSLGYSEAFLNNRLGILASAQPRQLLLRAISDGQHLQPGLHRHRPAVRSSCARSRSKTARSPS